MVSLMLAIVAMVLPTLKRLRVLGSSIFLYGQTFLFIYDDFWNNNKDYQYHNVLIGENIFF